MTKTRIDFGIALKNHPFSERLIDLGGFAQKDLISHRVALTALHQVGGEIASCLGLAYKLDA